MTYYNQILLGRITRIHGYEGAVAIRLEKTFIDIFPEPESVFIETEGKPVPFLISEWEYPGGDILKLKFKGYDSFEKVNEFNGSRVFLTSSSETKNTVKNTDTISGFKVLLNDKRVIGIIKNVIHNPGQYLLSILTPENKEILIPFHEDFIVKVNTRSKSITMDLPDGLTDLNDI